MRWDISLAFRCHPGLKVSRARGNRDTQKVFGGGVPPSNAANIYVDPRGLLEKGSDVFWSVLHQVA